MAMFGRALSFIRSRYAGSLLLHVIIILLLLIRFQPFDDQPKVPEHQQYVPSYMYQSPIVPPQQMPKYAAPKPMPEQQIIKPKEETSKNGLIKSKFQTHASSSRHKSILEMTHDSLQQQMQQSSANMEDTEPMLLVGDTNGVADPFVRLIGRAISANFRYPNVEGNLGLQGRVIVGVTLYPNGHFGNAQIIKSSDNDHFDAAALYAINQAPLVKGAHQFISKPKYLVIGFIFG
jgi:TonB family protein